MKIFALAAFAAVLAFAAPALAQENSAPDHSVHVNPANNYQGTRGVGTGAAADDRLTQTVTPAMRDAALYYNRQLLKDIKNALKSDDLTDEERATLKAKKADVEHAIVTLQQD